MRSEVCVTDPLHAGVSRGQTSLSLAVNKSQTETGCLLPTWETLNLEFTAEFKSVLSFEEHLLPLAPMLACLPSSEKKKRKETNVCEHNSTFNRWV